MANEFDSMKSKKELIIESFQTMNGELLDILLDENRTYFDATKKVFLTKLNLIFSELKAKGDTILVSHKGYCNADDCTNKGCTGYSFLGNKSKQHIDLIFDELNDDEIDIYPCSEFETIDKLVGRKNQIHIVIKHDEMAKFKPSTDFLIKSEQCKLAYQELLQFENQIIDKHIYLAWLEKFYYLYKSFEFPPIIYTEFNKFHTLYYNINELRDFLKSDHIAIEAVNEFQNIDISNETQLLKWLTKYEETSNNLELFLYDEIDFEKPEKRNYFKVDDLKINTSDFKYIARFKFLFDKYYWDMLDKYTTFSDEEQFRYRKADSEMSDLFSLLRISNPL